MCGFLRFLKHIQEDFEGKGEGRLVGLALAFFLVWGLGEKAHICFFCLLFCGFSSDLSVVVFAFLEELRLLRESFCTQEE